MEKNRLFKLETREEMLRMKAIYRFIHANGKTPEQVLEEYLTDKEKEDLRKLGDSITMEAIKKAIDKNDRKKSGK